MNNKKPLLVTTAIEPTWGNDEFIVFLGEWCQLYERRDIYSRRNCAVVRNHWDDRAKLRRDLDYLYSLHESLIEHLTQSLNRYHQMERPIRYWRMVMGPWLLFYLIVIFDRWECLRVAFETYGEMETVTLNVPDEPGHPFDYTDFVMQAAYSDVWNHQFFLRIIKFAYSDKCSITKLEKTRAPQNSLEGKPVSTSPALASRFKKDLLRQAAKFVDSLFGAVFTKYKVTFFTSYFPLQALVRISFALRQMPRLYLGEFEWPIPLKGYTNHDASKHDRTLLTLTRSPSSNFEAFLNEQIILDLPYAYAEGFPLLLEKARKIRISTKAICSANAHWQNELFKTWSAEQVINGVKFIAVEHGGGIPGYFETMHFEGKVADWKVVSARPYYPNHIQMPFSKLVTRIFRSTKEYCSVIGFESFRYCLGLGGPISGQALECFRMICSLYAGLKPELRDKFKVKPYPDIGWNTRQRFIDKLGVEKVFLKGSYYRVLAKSRLVVCTYPQTTFSEAMASGLPTILCYPAHLWESNPAMDQLLEILKAANIVFHDPQAAAEHLNRIWQDPEKWWGSQLVVHAREEFFKNCLDIDRHWLQRWKVFLEEISK